MLIKVLQHHIDEGLRRNAYFCAVAMAIREKFPDAEQVSVGAAAHIDGKHYTMPQHARSFIACFDRECKDPAHLQPFEFDLTPMENESL